MGRVSVRQAITSVFEQGQIEFVGTVYAARPLVMSEDDYMNAMLGESMSDSGSGAVLVVNLIDTTEQRRADTGRGAINDSVIHSVAVEVFFTNTGGDAVQAQYDYDAIIDASILLIRSNPTMAGGSWSAGEYTNGVKHTMTEPYSDADGLVVYIPGVITFEAWEWNDRNVASV